MRGIIRNDYRIYFQGLRKLWRDPRLSRSAKVILLDLLLYAGVDGVSFPSQETLALNHGLTTRQVRNLLKQLKPFGIDWERGKIGRSNKYHFSEEIYASKSKTDRKPVSVDIRNEFPVQIGSTFPTKEVNESNQINGSQEILQQYKNSFKGNHTSTDLNRISVLSNKYSISWVKQAISEVSFRNLVFVKPGLIESVLQDWQHDGRPKPKFRECGKDRCNAGQIWDLDNGCYIECTCHKVYGKILQEWKGETQKKL